ncbi:hypothetical protein EGH24_01055 [Halonotius terrestris]|uniref:Uncharacterized protein n=1 Tax=Halonotius terrestris TaxID=2487750 RepID=A0A8J8P9B0_9EURY|nr:DUF5791 family protein [Halonotius terrestris]TQQ83413.1 hypothetical protein EGH24_01055 [Halonotius terrestris]
MLHTVADETADLSPDGLLSAYEAHLQTVLDTVGVDTAVAETDLDRDTIEAVVDGDVAGLTLTEAAAIAALDDDAPDAEAIVLETRDHLLMGMTTAVLDVDAISANLDVDLTGQEVQQAIEGRIDMTLAELAAIQSVIEQRLEE